MSYPDQSYRLWVPHSHHTNCDRKFYSLGSTVFKGASSIDKVWKFTISNFETGSTNGLLLLLCLVLSCLVLSCLGLVWVLLFCFIRVCFFFLFCFFCFCLLFWVGRCLLDTIKAMAWNWHRLSQTQIGRIITYLVYTYELRMCTKYLHMYRKQNTQPRVRLFDDSANTVGN